MLKRLALLLLVAASLQAQPIRVAVDATDAARKRFHSRMTIPAQAGPMRLAYAKWIPGEHGPTGPITDLVNVRVTANGAPVAWRREPVDMFLLNIDVPKGASEIQVEATFIAPIAGGQFTAGPSATANLAVLSWNTLLLFPPGRAGDDTMVEGSIAMPEGWTQASALAVASDVPGRVAFKPASLTTYVDSPVIIGRHLKKIDIPAKNAPPHRIDIVADSANALTTPDGFAQSYSNLAGEAGAVFGAHHFRKYDWLVTLSDHVAHFGLEHHESSDNRMPERTLSTEYLQKSLGSLLAHEYVHSWNGKHRRPAVMLSADYQQPMHGELLWVYEGMTNYLGWLLAARAGLWTDEYWREQVAAVAATFDVQPGRTWRPLGDTAVAAQSLFGSADAWRSMRRGVDFYAESNLLWLEVDAIIRQKSNGRASLDDFLRRFYGGPGGQPSVKPYTLDDVVATLNAVAAHDWRAHLTERLWATSPRAPVGGIAAHGWRLEYNDTPNAAIQGSEGHYQSQELWFSLGLSLNKDGVVKDAIAGGPAEKAGIGPGMKVIAVNGRRWTKELLEIAIREAKGTTAPIEMLTENGEFFRTHRIDYHGGLRYPHLVRDTSKPDTLADVLKARR